MLAYREMFATPYVLIFVVTWLLLRLIDELEVWGGARGPLYPLMRLVIILVALILVLI